MIPYKTLGPNGQRPRRQRARDAGYDVYAAEDFWLPLLVPRKIRTEIAVAVPDSHVLKFFDRSGTGSRGVLTLAGVIDENYRGELLVCLVNLNALRPVQRFRRGDRICQALIFPIVQDELEECDDLDETDRGEAGFGSSGR